MKTLHWLWEHGEKILSPAEWEKLLQTRILDRDGWRDGTPWEAPIPLLEFVRRAGASTIGPEW